MVSGGQVFEVELVPSDPAATGNVWVRFVRWVIMSRVAWLVVAANLIGGLTGLIFWYGDTILEAPWYYWVFVPDCPLAAIFMGLALMCFHLGRRWDWLGLLAVGTCIKYGLWTVFYWAANYSAGGQYHFEAVSMSLTHLIMIVEGLMLTTFLRFRVWPVLVAALYLVANDLVDYVAGYYPRLPRLVGLELMRRVAISMTVIIVVSWAAMTVLAGLRKRKQMGESAGEAG